jgi:hypothetical protein
MFCIAAAGHVDPSWNPQGNNLGIYVFKGEDWTTINGKHHSQIDSLRDYISVAADPLMNRFGQDHLAEDSCILRRISPLRYLNKTLAPAS